MSGAYPRRIDGYHGDSRISEDQVEFLLARLPEAGRLLEIGSASGTTAAFIADRRPRASIVCVDNYDGLALHLEVALRLMDWRRNQRRNMALWIGTSAALRQQLDPAARFDLAFVDADHSFDCTLDCLGDAAEMLAPGGRIVAHDWLDPSWPDVAPAVRAFCAGSGFVVEAEAEHICALARPEDLS